jgi:hypothetical protein
VPYGPTQENQSNQKKEKTYCCSQQITEEARRSALISHNQSHHRRTYNSTRGVISDYNQIIMYSTRKPLETRGCKQQTAAHTHILMRIKSNPHIERILVPRQLIL